MLEKVRLEELRRTTVEKFYTFVGTYKSTKRNDPVTYKWVTDSQLRANIISKMEQYPDQNEEFWVDHFVKAVQNNSDNFAEMHLLAYLDEACYRAVKSIQNELLIGFKSTPLDCFQIARGKAKDNWQKIFNAYKPDEGKLIRWAQLKLRGAIIDELQRSAEYQNISDWRLLKSCSKKALRKALQRTQITEPKFSSCMLVWQGFQEVYSSTRIQSPQRQLPEPTEQQWEDIADYYNSSALSGDGNKTIDEINKLLKICIEALRRRIQFIYLDGEDSQLVEVVEVEITKQYQDWYLDNIEDCELSEEMIVALGKTMAFPPKSIDGRKMRKMLILEHGLIKFKQTDIGQEFNIRQDNVSRLLSKYKKILVKEILKYLEKHYRVTVNTEVIDKSSKQINGWLYWYFQKRIIYRLLQTILRLHPQLNQDINVLRWYFGTNTSIVKKIEKIIKEFNLVEESELEHKLIKVESNLNRSQNQQQLTSEEVKSRLSQIEEIFNDYDLAVKQELNISSHSQLHQKIVHIRSILQKKLQAWLHNTINVSSNCNEAIEKSSELVVEQFLRNAPYSEIILEMERKRKLTSLQ